MFEKDVGYKCGCQADNGNQVECKTDNCIEGVEGPAGLADPPVDTDEDRPVVRDGVLAPPHVLVDPEHSARVVEGAVSVPVTGGEVHLHQTSLAGHRDSRPVGAHRHLPAHIEGRPLGVLTENIKFDIFNRSN